MPSDITPTLDEYFIRIKYSFIAGMGIYFTFCATTRALIAKQIGHPERAEDALQLWFSLYFLDFPVRQGLPGSHISFWATTPLARNGNYSFCHSLGAD
jgi:hypothetical protein